ncbi:MAG: EamA family transporter [Rhodoglobus sp.]
MALAVILALGSALAYGVSDFLGGTAAARLRVMPTTILSYASATIALTALILVTGGEWSAGVVLSGVVAGVAAVVGFVTFYAAMAIGPMSLVSPVIAVLGSAVPVAAAVLLGERLSGWAWLGIVLALAGAVLISSQPKGGGGHMTIRAAVLSIVSGISLGGSVIALDRAPAGSGSLAAFVEIVIGLVLLALAAGTGVLIATVGQGLRNLGGTDTVPGNRRANIGAALAAGVLLGAANAGILAALQTGSLAIVSVLVGLYPLATLLLARIVGGERIARLQLAGGGLAIAASVVLGFALGGAA